jgi:DNA (cytosine-5)-methyltransferase 1
MLRAISLFSGIGGIDLAFARAGFDIVAQVEINPFCQEVLQTHARHYWPNAIVYADITRTGVGREHELPSADVVFGGFPCQDISNAGKRAGVREGKRSGLWYEMERIISEVRPRAVFLENVDAIIYPGRGGTDVVAALAGMGYVGQAGIVSARDAGASHLRRRWLAVGYAGSLGHTESATTDDVYSDPFRQHPAPQCSGQNEFYAPVADGKSVEHDDSERRQKCQPATVTAGQRQSGGRHAACRRARVSQSRVGRVPDGLPAGLDGYDLMAHRFPAPPGQPPEHWEPPRTVAGGSRIAARLEALGNAVVPQVIYPIAEMLYQRLMAQEAV